MSRIVAELVLLVAVSGCASIPQHGRAPDPVSHRRVEAPDTAPTAGAGAPVLISDDEMTLFPDPVDRTTIRMAELRHRIAQYARTRERLPDSLEQFLPGPPVQSLADFEHDAWNIKFRYTRLGDDYELRSAGPDGRFDTTDDLVVSATKGTKWNEDGELPSRKP